MTDGIRTESAKRQQLHDPMCVALGRLVREPMQVWDQQEVHDDSEAVASPEHRQCQLTHRNLGVDRSV